jgi:hypothetical protein
MGANVARSLHDMHSLARGARRFAFALLSLAIACWSPPESAAGQYSARVRWAPSPSSGVIEYEVYRRPVSGAYGPAEPGTPTLSGGVYSLVVADLDVRTDYAFSVKAVGATASSTSNELRIGYTDVASVLDSDGDGLTEAEEDLNLNRRVDAGESNPDVADSDADGVGDQADTCEGTAAGAAVNTAGCSCAQVTCNDGDACNGTETCSAGVCRAGTAPVCNDGNACTTDSCVPATGCRYAAIAGCCTTSAQCDDGNGCNGLETCQSGTCRAGTSLACGDADPCTTDTCSPTAGCQHAPVAGCASCTSASQCNDANPCTTDTCASGTCRNAPVANGTPCADGNACNGAETCQSGACRAGTPLTCASDGNPCTIESCDPAAGCGSRPAADGAACGDGNACNGAETCRSGACQPGTPLGCADTNACTTDTCDPSRGCVRRPVADGTPCGADRGFCAGTDVCRAGACIAGTPPSCDDGNACTTDACSDALGRCTHQSGPGCCQSDADCADSDACTTEERCVAGACVTTPVACPAAGPCATSRCDAAKGCMAMPRPDGTTCDDGDACTTGDACTSGRCAGTPGRRCPDPGPCAANRCDPVLGCTPDPVPDGTPCDDGDRCTLGEACIAGACRAPATRAALPQMAVERFAVRSAGRDGQRLRGRALLPGAFPMDLRAAELDFAIVDAAGAPLYHAALPASALRVEARRDGLRLLLEDSPDPRLRRLIVSVRGDTLRVFFTVVGPELVPMDATNLTLRIRAGNGCAREKPLLCRPGRLPGLVCASAEPPARPQT